MLLFFFQANSWAFHTAQDNCKFKNSSIERTYLIPQSLKGIIACTKLFNMINHILCTRIGKNVKQQQKIPNKNSGAPESGKNAKQQPFLGDGCDSCSSNRDFLWETKASRLPYTRQAQTLSQAEVFPVLCGLLDSLVTLYLQPMVYSLCIPRINSSVRQIRIMFVE